MRKSGFALTIRRRLHTSLRESQNSPQHALEALDSVLNQLEQQNLKVRFSDSYSALIRQCAEAGSLPHAKRLHAQIVSGGHGENGYLAGLLVHMYAKCGDLENAQAVFDTLPRKKSVLWNIMIGEYDRIGDSEKAWKLYQQMDAEPDKVTFVLALRICAALRKLLEGNDVYRRVCSSPFRGVLKLQNGAISMYSKCGSLDLAREVFDRMESRDVVSWNSMITAYAQFGHPKEVLVLYKKMMLEGLQANGITFSSIFSACRSEGEVRTAEACIKASQFHSDVVALNALVSAYARCRSLEAARAVFDGIQQKDLISWNSMIAAYSQQGHSRETIELFQKMDVEPDAITFASVLGACSYIGEVELGREVHAQIAKSRFKSDSMVGTSLIHMYCKCGLLDVAMSVFDGIAFKSSDPSPWNAMISGFVQHGQPKQALNLYKKMESQSIQPDKITFLSALGACSASQDLKEGVRIHEQASACGNDKDSIVQTALFNMYAKCKRVDLARQLFDGMKEKSVVPWNVMIATYSQSDDKAQNRQALDLYGLMDAEGVQPDEITFTHLLSACVNLGALADAKAIHERIIRSRCKTTSVLETAILTMYAKFNMLDVARSEFNKMQVKSVTSWNAMISAYSQHGHSKKALLLFHEMNLEGFKADGRTFLSVLGACASLQALEMGRYLQEQALSMGFEVVETASVSLYAKCGRLEVAREIFEKLKNKTVVSWNSMIAAYAQNGYGKESLELYDRMRKEGFQPDEITYAGALGACPSYGGSSRGAEIHQDIIQSRVKPDVFLKTAIVNMYGKCGVLETARMIFDEMKDKNVVSWSAMVGAYIQHGYDREALDLYLKMDSEGFQPSEVTLVGVLAACSRIGALQEGKGIHARIMATCNLSSSLPLQNSVLNMYAKCGCLGAAKNMFEKMQQRDSFSWNTVIVAHAHHGDVDEVLELHKEMLLDGFEPDYVTFACILLACSHAGLVEEGRDYFHSMEMEFGVVPDGEHYLCMVDMLSRAGRVDSAEELIHNMPYEPPALAWTTLLGSPNIQSDPDRGLRYAGNAAVLEPGSSSSYVLLWNIFSRNKALDHPNKHVG